MSRKRQLATGIAALAAATLTLSACGAGTSAETQDGGTAEVRVWLVGSDTPDEARQYLIDTFAEQHDDAKIVIEEQVWSGLVDKLSTSLSGSDSPDVVEMGNTQAPTFTTVGAFQPLDEYYEELGGDDLLQGFVDAGTADGTLYAVPYYAGSRLVFYNKNMVDEPPETLQEYVELGAELKQEHSDVQAFSGIWWPGQDWRNGLPFIWAAGGDIAVQQDDGTWKATLSSPESIEGLTDVQEAMLSASGAPADADETDPQVPFCAEKSAMLSAPGWVLGTLTDPEQGCPEMKDAIGVFALPGTEPGTTAPVFLGGSNLAVSANAPHPDLALDALRIMLSEEYQTIMAEHGLIPAKASLVDAMGDDPVAQAAAAAAQNTRIPPATPGWANVESARIMEDLFQQLAQGNDVQAAAAEADQRITEALNS